MSLSPNTMTIIGNLLAWISFFILLSMNPEHRLLFLVPAILRLPVARQHGRHQARRTGRSSRSASTSTTGRLVHRHDGLRYGISTGLEP